MCLSFFFSPRSLAIRLLPKDHGCTFSVCPAGKAVGFMFKSMGFDFRLPEDSSQLCHFPDVTLGKVLHFFLSPFFRL